MTFTAMRVALVSVCLWQVGVLHAQSSLPHYGYAACPTNNVVNLTPSGSTTTSADYDAIQRAINDVSAQGGGTVALGLGTYSIVSPQPLVMQSNVSLCAPNGATLKYVGTYSGQLLASGRIYNDTPISNVQILNITFDNGVVLLLGDKFRVERNTFQNITTFAPANDSSWGGLGAGQLSNSTVWYNRFVNLRRTGFMGYMINNSSIKENTFVNVYEPIHVFDIWDSKIVGNFASGTTRMGIEIQHGETKTNADLPGLVVSDNRFVNWAPDPNEGNVIALSIVAGRDTQILRNTLVCGSGCYGSDKGWGMEISGSGATLIQANTVRAFGIGIGVAAPAETVKVFQNAIYDADLGITKFNNGYLTTSFLVDGNYIENARSTAIGAPDWYYAFNPVIRNNVITRRAGAWAGDSTRTYSAIGAAGLDARSAPMVIQSNTVLFEGAPVSGFTPVGVFLGGANGSLSGLSIDNNRIGSDGSASHGLGVLLNSWGASTGVKLSANKFQNLQSLLGGVPENNFLATGNTAVNMGGGAISPSSLASNQNVVFPALTISPSTLTGKGPLPASFSATGSNGFVPVLWHFGDGNQTGTKSTATSPSASVKYLYLLSSQRTASLLSVHPSGAVIVSKAAVNEQ